MMDECKPPPLGGDTIPKRFVTPPSSAFTSSRSSSFSSVRKGTRPERRASHISSHHVM